MSFGGEIKKGDRLSPREEEVFRFLGAGLFNKQIAWEQSRGRVNFHMWTSSPMVAEWRQSRFSLMDIMSQ